MKLKERLEQARKNLEEVKAAVEKGEKKAEDLKTAMDEFNDAQQAYNAAVEAEDLIKSMGSQKKDEKKKARNLGEYFVQAVKAKNLGEHFHVSAPAYKAASDPILSPEGAVGFATTYDRNLVEGTREALAVRDLFGAESISGSTLVYLVEGATEGAAAVTAEGEKKPQIHFADPTPKTVSLKKIACFVKESDEYINDFAFLESVVNGRLLYELGLAEQTQLVADLIGTSGIQSDSTSWTADSSDADVADIILKGLMDTQESSGFAADAIVMSPATWYMLRIAKNDNGNYYGGGFFGAQDGPNLWGVPVCVTNAVTDSQIIVGAFKTCASVVTNGGVSVEAVNTNEDDFVNNLMTIRAEERLALAVRRPFGFKLITKA